MKRLIYLLPMAALLLAACNVGDDENGNTIWDIYPVGFYITAHDAEGNDLLALTPKDQKNLDFIRGIKVEYEGPEHSGEYTARNLDYYLNGYQGNPYGDGATTRAYMPVFHGLFLAVGTSQDGKLDYKLVFGELEGNRNYDDARFTVTWPDGQQNVMQYSRTVKWENGKPDIKTSILLDGKSVTSAVVARTF